MRLSEILIVNFQAHRELRIPVPNGILVIKGDSDKGKTSAIRGINWLLDNKPSGFSFRHNPILAKIGKKPLPDKAITSVRFTFDDGSYVERARDNNKINHYDLNGTKYSALRGDVPKEVTDFLNIAACTVQNQHDPFFLISDSSGEAAKKINNLIGLEDIDKFTKNINTIVTDLKRESERVEKELQENREEYRTYRFLDAAGKLVNSIDGDLAKSEKDAIIINEIERLRSIIEDSKEELKGIAEWLTVEPRYEAVMRQIETLKKIIEEYDNISSTVSELVSKQDVLESLSWLEEFELTLQSVVLSNEELKELQRDYQDLLAIKYQILGYKDDIEDSEAIIIEKIEIYQSTLGEVCPFCGQAINKETLCCQ